MVNKKRTLALASVACLLVQMLAIVGSSPAWASTSGAPSGAIFTTDENGTRVNANIYEDKRDVYIDGGPGANAPQSAAGLDDGNYYFQVTGTDGKALFSTDPVKCREFRVKDGIIVEYVSANRTFAVPGGFRFCHLDGKQNGRHDTGVDQDHGAVTIQLMPYNNTSNPGGVYKVWVTSTTEFQGNASLVDNSCDSGCEHGFKHSASKTDNFKVRASGSTFVAPLLTVKKFDDWDGDGTWDSGEPEIGVDSTISGGGWPVAVVDPAGLASYGYTRYTYQVGFAGNYTTVEGTNSGWSQTALIVDGSAKTVNTTARVKFDYTDGETHTVAYGNFKSFEVSGAKVNDANGNGKWDSGESTLSGWKIQLYRGGSLFKETTTGSDGTYSFQVSVGGSFQVKEVAQSGWTQTGAKDYSFTAKSGVDRKGLVFTNHQDSAGNSGPGCLVLCITLNVAVSVNLDLTISFNAAATTSVSAFVLSCADVIADVTANVTATVAVDTDTGCGCDTGASGSGSGSGDVNTCEQSCTNTCQTGCSNTCNTGCGSGSTDTSVNVSVDVSADVGAGGSAGGSSGGSCGCESDSGASGSADTTADVTVDVSADVGVDVGSSGSSGGDCGCGSTSASTDADVSVDVSADVAAGVDVGL